MRDLAARGRVARASSYHAHQHGIRFEDIVTALAFCQRVVPDARTDDQGLRLHPEGYIAVCPYRSGRSLRVDLNRHVRDDGDVLLVVTAMEFD